MFSTYLRISRPRFWMFLLGPYLIGAFAAGRPPASWWEFVTLGLYFTFPANLLVYGLNDLFDYQLDRRHSRKRGYDVPLDPVQQRRLIKSIWLWNVPLLTVWLVSGLPFAARTAMLAFIFLAVFYAVPPIRARNRPIFDGLFSAFYILPGVVSYGLVTGMYPPLLLVAAGVLWFAAMHYYAAVPDISTDTKAGLHSTATWLGARRTLLFCLAGYILAAAMAYKWLGLFSVLAGVLYAGMALTSLANPHRHHVLKIYRRLPFINMLVGTALFLWTAVSK